MIYQSWYWSDHLAEVVFVSLLHSKVILFIIIIINYYYHYHFCIKIFILYFVEGSYYAYYTHRVGGYANQLEGGMSAQLLWNSSTWEISRTSGFVCFFFRMLFIYLREREERKTMSEWGRWRRTSRFPAEHRACLGTWIMIWA